MKTWPSIGLLFPLFALALLCACATEPEPVVPEPTVPEPATVTEIAPLPNEIIREVERVITTPPETLMPLTTSILQRLNDSDMVSRNINRYQLLLFGRVLLEREYTQSDTYVEAGRAKFDDVHIRDNITINDQTEGQAIATGITGDEIVLSVCFEQEEKYQLKFSAISSEPDSYFYLNYYSYHDNLSPMGDEKGLLEYDGLIYKLKYAGDKRPYLLIKLSQNETDKINSRTASGRKVN